ncbi:MAG: DUF86 domain-containing protein [Candidatus Margulisiibacteriota bacterium]
MRDKELALEILSQICRSAQIVLDRFEPITEVNDLAGSAEGMEKMDSICMQLVAIGESLKKLDKITDYKLLSQYSEIDWKGAKGLRDIITHQYFEVDAEAIFYVCQNRIRPLLETIKRIKQDINPL